MKEKSQEGKEMLLLFANNMNHPESLYMALIYSTRCVKKIKGKNKRKYDNKICVTSM